jgi:hypothetical protein
MIKFRVWDITNQKFIYPVLDITSEFELNYPVDKFIFDRLIDIVDDVEIYQNDIVEADWMNDKRKVKRFLGVVVDTNYIERFNEYLYRHPDKVYEHLYPVDGLTSYRQHYTKFNSQRPTKLGNIHQNFNLIEDQYTIYLNLKTKNAKK